MTDCIKTGARVHFTDYNVILPADAYDFLGSNYIFVFNMALFHNREVTLEADTITHTVRLPRGESLYFWHKDKGILVVPAEYVALTQSE